MSPKEWKTLIAYGLLVGAVSMYDGKLAVQVVGLSSLVVLVRNADKVESAAKSLGA